MAAVPGASIRLEIESQLGGAKLSFDLPFGDVVSRDLDGNTPIGAYALRWSANESQPAFDLTRLSRDWTLEPADVFSLVSRFYSPSYQPEEGLALPDMDVAIGDVIQVMSVLLIDVDPRTIAMPNASFGTRRSNANFLDNRDAIPVALTSVLDNLDARRGRKLWFVQFAPRDIGEQSYYSLVEMANAEHKDMDRLTFLGAPSSWDSENRGAMDRAWLDMHREWVQDGSWRKEFLTLLAEERLVGSWGRGPQSERFGARWVLTVEVLDPTATASRDVGTNTDPPDQQHQQGPPRHDNLPPPQQFHGPPRYDDIPRHMLRCDHNDNDRWGCGSSHSSHHNASSGGARARGDYGSGYNY